MREPTTPKLYRWNTTTDEIKSIYEPQKLQCHRVGNYVNSPKNNDPKCIDAI